MKKKGVVGGCGGGVVGLEFMKCDNGFFCGFGWGNISLLFGDLFGGGELSMIKEMCGVVNLKFILLFMIL